MLGEGLAHALAVMATVAFLKAFCDGPLVFLGHVPKFVLTVMVLKGSLHTGTRERLDSYDVSRCLLREWQRWPS